MPIESTMLYLSAIILSFFLSFMLLAKKQKSNADPILIAWLFVIGMHLLSFYLIYTKQAEQYPSWAALGIPLPLVHGPFLYLYTTWQTSGKRFQRKELIHFLPVLLSYTLFARFFFLPFADRANVFRSKGGSFELESKLNLYAVYISGMVYIGLSLYKLLKYKKNLVHRFSNTEKITFNWLLYLICWMMLIWVIVLYTGETRLIFGVAAFFVMWIGYFSIHQVQVFNYLQPHAEDAKALTSSKHNKESNSREGDTRAILSTKYQNAALSEQVAASIHDQLKQLLEEEKPFLNPELTLNDLAKRVNVHPNVLSQVINSRENKTFYDLINERRIAEFTARLSAPGHQQYTLLSIAYDCGFNSKASFNRNFKKFMQVTPSEYLKQKNAQPEEVSSLM
jgi:AraC-like DNA-binding protein